MSRKYRSFYGEKIKNALKHDQPMLQSEKLPSYLPFFVNWDLLEEIHNNTNHLIIGRRGTGKTHLLGAFDEYVNSSECENEMSIMISLARISQTPPSTEGETPDFTSKKMAKQMFLAFLRIFFQRFLDKTDILLKTQIHGQRTAKEFEILSKEYNSLFTRLLEAIELGRAYSISKHKTIMSSKEGADKSKLGGKFNVGLKKMIPILDIDVNIEGEMGEGEMGEAGASKSSQEIQSILAVDLSEVRDLILKILQLLDIRPLYILIDEWMELEKNTPSSIQAIFAQLLKEVFFNHKLISVKIASIWHQTTLYDRNDVEKAKGIELGHDIQIGTNLDTAFLTSEDEVFSFCKDLLYKRLVHQCPALKELEQEDGKIDNIFITEIFDTEMNFRSFIAASHGIPRDLMKIFQKCSLRIKRDFENHCIDYKLISDVAKDLYIRHKRKTIDPNSLAQLMLNRINDYLEKTGRRLFLVKNKDVAESRALRKLVDEELIHQMPSGMTHRKIRDKYKAFHIDYGNYVDWIDAQEMNISELIDESIIPDFPEGFEEDYSSFVLQVVEDSECTCEFCKKRFTQTNLVYKKLGGCPFCGESSIICA